MFTLFVNKPQSDKAEHKEGDLYKVITVYGKTFEIYYGYYEESDRHSRYAKPIEVFPDFLKKPVYTEEGIPFVTAIQPPCEYFKKVKDVNDCCGDCAFYKQGEEWIGICKHKAKWKNTDENE